MQSPDDRAAARSTALGVALLDDLERDALTELLNIGVSQAAVTLRKLVEHKIILSVPAVEVLTVAHAADLIWQREGGAIVAVAQSLSGPFAGRALLIFPTDSGASLAALLLGRVGEAPDRDFEDEALAETGNIVLNACFGSMGNMLAKQIHLSTPSVLRSNGKDLFDHVVDPQAAVVLFLYINFTIDQRKVRGYVALVMDLPSIQALKSVIGRFVDAAMEA